MSRTILPLVVALAAMACAPDDPTASASDYELEPSANAPFDAQGAEYEASDADVDEIEITVRPDGDPVVDDGRRDDQDREDDDPGTAPGHDDEPEGDLPDDEPPHHEDDDQSSEAEPEQDERPEERAEDLAENRMFEGGWINLDAQCGDHDAPVQIELNLSQDRMDVAGDLRIDNDSRLLRGRVWDDTMEMHEGEEHDLASQMWKVEAVVSEDATLLDIVIRDHERLCTATLVRHR